MREAKAFARAGFALPEGAKRVLRREESLKKYNAELVHALNAYQQSLARIIPSLKPLLSNALEDLETRMQPGLTTLTWAGLNIDAFLHSITSAVNSLNDVIDRVHDIVKNKIEKHVRVTLLAAVRVLLPVVDIGIQVLKSADCVCRPLATSCCSTFPNA